VRSGHDPVYFIVGFPFYSVVFPLVTSPYLSVADHNLGRTTAGNRPPCQGSRRPILVRRVTFHIRSISFSIVNVPRTATVCPLPAGQSLSRPNLLTSERLARPALPPQVYTIPPI